MATTGGMEYGVFVNAGVGQGSMEYEVFVAAGLLASEHRLWVKINGEWQQITAVHAKAGGAWLLSGVWQKFGQTWVPLMT